MKRLYKKLLLTAGYLTAGLIITAGTAGAAHADFMSRWGQMIAKIFGG